MIDESATFRAALATIDLQDPVPTCPGWNASDLLWHLTEVQHFWGTVVSRRLVDSADYSPPERPADRLFDDFDRAHATLVDALRNTADDVPVWTWAADDQHVGFVRRRQTHEALIHRLDAELTAGLRSPLDPALATDGVDEALTVMIGGLPDWGVNEELGPIGHITTSDTGRTWIVQMCTWSGTSPNTGTVLSSEPGLFVATDGDPDFTIAGTAGDLDAWLWSRPTVAPLDRRGDTSTIDDLVAIGID